MKTKKELYANEKVISTYTYPESYESNRHKLIDDIVFDFEAQAKCLDKLFNCGKKFDTDWLIRAHAVCPVWVEKFFANLDWRCLAPTYGEAVSDVLRVIRQERKFLNYHKDNLGAEYLRESAKSAKMSRRLGRQQKDCDILIFPAQFGLRHKGRSVRRAHECFAGNEFGLGACATGIMLLTHPERESKWEQLHIDCAGDEFAPEAVGVFSCTPIFGFCIGGLEFGARWLGAAHEDYGSASAFLP